LEEKESFALSRDSKEALKMKKRCTRRAQNEDAIVTSVTRRLFPYDNPSTVGTQSLNGRPRLASLKWRTRTLDA